MSMDLYFWPDFSTIQFLCHYNSNPLCYLLFEAHPATNFLGNKFRSTCTLIRMQPQVSLVSDDGIALLLSLLTFTKPVT